MVSNFPFKNLFLDLLFPRACLGCGKKGTYVCPDCLALLSPARDPRKDIKGVAPVYFASYYNQSLVKTIIHKFKYPPFSKDLAKALVLIIIAHFKTKEKHPCFLTGKNRFFVLPVPLSSKRLRWRGFNQAQKIASLLARYYELPLVENGLEKKRNTLAQAELPSQKRKNNLKNAFSCPRPQKIKNKNIVLVDDVVTTGTTLREAGKALKKAGAKKVCAVTAACG